jgi:hypothetical protein
MMWIMKNIMKGLMLTTSVLAQLNGDLLGSRQDEHDCSLDGGYQWCESLNECIRPWITPCVDPPIDPPIDPNYVSSNTIAIIEVPYNCASWYDGCNTCDVTNGVVTACTMMMCFINNTPECLSYYSYLNENDICYRFCEDGSQSDINRQNDCPSGTECTSITTLSYDSCNDNAWKCISQH